MTNFAKTLCLGALLLALLGAWLSIFAQETEHRLSKDEVVKLLEGHVTPHHIGQRAREQGINFQITPRVDSELRSAGATDELIDTLLDIEAKTGEIRVHTSPGAEIYLDDRYSGRASDEGRLLFSDAKPGQHSIRVTASGKKEFDETLTVIAGQENKVEAALQDALGSLRVQTSAGAEVFLDESSRGKADGSGQLTLSDVPAGTHQLRVSAEGKADFRQAVTLLADRDNAIQATLAPAGAAMPIKTVATSLAGTSWDVTFVCYDYDGACREELNPGEKKPEKHPRMEYHTTMALGDNGTCSLPSELLPCQWFKTGQVVNITRKYNVGKYSYVDTWGLTIDGSTMSGDYHGATPSQQGVPSGEARVTMKVRD